MKLIIGPPNSGKTREAISRLSDALSHQNKNALLIVPSASSQSIVFDRLESFLCAQNIASNKPRQVVKTFPALYTEILTEAKRAYRVLKKVERDRLIRRTIRELDEQKSLSYFDSIARSAGLVAALSHFIDELWRSGTDEEKFSLIASARDAKDRDIALIFARYRARLQASGLIDVEGAGLEALRALEQRAIKNPADRFSMIVADGFDFYTPVQVGLLSRLSRLGVETMATLTYEEGRAVHLWQEPTRRRFEAAGAEIIELQSSPADEISRAAARLMDDRHSQADDSESAPITIFSAPDRATEVRAAAREIKKLILESRFAPDDITIVCRSLALYSSHLEKIFRECSIPITIDSPLRLDENPAVIALLRLLALSSESFPRRAVIDCLRSPFFDLSRFNLDEQAVNHLDHASIAGNVTRKREQWMEALSAAAERKPEQRSDYFSPKETDKRYPKLLESLDDFFNEVTLPASAAPLLFAQRALHLLESFDIENRAGDENSDATKSLRALLEEMRDDAIESTGEVAQATFYNDLERAIGATVIERDSSSLSVLAQEAHNLRPRRYRAVFVLGLIEGEFPARATERFPYTLVEREQLRSASVDLTETTSDAGADLTQFYKAMASATERLYLAYARTDLAGSELLRSYLVDEIEACARAEKIMIPQQAATFERVRMDEIISLDELALITAREIGRSLDEDRDTSRQARIASSLLEQRMASWRFVWRGAQMERDRLAGTRGRFNGVMESADILEEIRRKFGAHYMWSASQINDYGVCPFRFFARHALRLKPIDEPVEGFVPARLGSAYHKILEKTYERLRESKLEITIETAQVCADKAASVAEETLEEMARSGEIRQGVFWEFDKVEIRRNVARLLIQEARWNAERATRPVAFEEKFGFEGRRPLVVECSEGEIKIRGAIDRIDESEDGWIVIDYKTTRTPIKRSDAIEGRNLQLPIYLMAARHLRPDAPVSSAYYLHITSRKKGSEIPHADDERLSIEGVIAHAEGKIREYTVLARSGKFPVAPNNNRCHQGCEYESMCRIGSLKFEI